MTFCPYDSHKKKYERVEISMVAQSNNMIYFLLHPAGGSNLTMRGINKCLKANGCEVYAIDLPGHGELIEQAPFYEFDTAVGYLSRMIKNIVVSTEDEFCIVGHSMGGLLAYAVEHRLEHNYYLQAKKIVVLASSSPDVSAGRLIDNPKEISDSELISKVSKLGGIPESVKKSKELLEILCPVLRADFIILDSYHERKAEGNEVASDLVVMTGKQDVIINDKEIVGWKKFTLGKYQQVSFEGNHFFYQQCEKRVCEEMK